MSKPGWTAANCQNSALNWYEMHFAVQKDYLKMQEDISTPCMGFYHVSLAVTSKQEPFQGPRCDNSAKSTLRSHGAAPCCNWYDARGLLYHAWSIKWRNGSFQQRNHICHGRQDQDNTNVTIIQKTSILGQCGQVSYIVAHKNMSEIKLPVVSFHVLHNMVMACILSQRDQ